MSFEQVWAAIRRHAGEEFYQLGGTKFIYQADDDSLTPSTLDRPIGRAVFERAYSSGLLGNLRQFKQEFGTQEHTYLFSILTDPRIVKP